MKLPSILKSSPKKRHLSHQSRSSRRRPGPTISHPAAEVEVVEVYGVGTFKTPKGDA